MTLHVSLLLFFLVHTHHHSPFEILPIKAIHVRFYNHIPREQPLKAVPHPMHLRNNKVVMHQVQPKHRSKPHPTAHPRRAQHELKGKQLSQLVNYLFTQIHQHYHYPDDAAAMDEQGVSIVTFTLLPSGVIQHVQVLHSSSYELLDQAAVAAIRDAAPFTQAHRFIQQQQSFSLPIRSA